MTVALWCYPKIKRKAMYFVKEFSSASVADAWLQEHNHELSCFCPDYWSDTVQYAEQHLGEDMRMEVTLF